MKSLQDINNNLLKTDKEKLEGLIRNHFVWNMEGRKVDEEEEMIDHEEVEAGGLEKMIKKVEIVLSGTQNSSAPEPDGIS